MNAPGFWDEPDEAKETMRRLYELQRAADASDALRRRAGGLVDARRSPCWAVRSVCVACTLPTAAAGGPGRRRGAGECA